MLTKFDDNIWIHNGQCVQFYHVPFPTRMIVVKLDNDELWIHSPCHLDAKLKSAVDKLGIVKYLISPNKLHHLFIKEWTEAYPDAKCYASPGVAKKRPDIPFFKTLDDHPEPQWQAQLGQLIFRGSVAMEEVVFYHRDSRTLIVTDLVENFDPSTLTYPQRLFARFAGILAPLGKTPLDWRLSFLFGRREAKNCLQTIIDWNPERLIMSHGLIVENNATTFLKQSFSWLQTP